MHYLLVLVRDKQTFLMKGSFALLLFVLLGYMVKFYPETLIPRRAKGSSRVAGYKEVFVDVRDVHRTEQNR